MISTRQESPHYLTVPDVISAGEPESPHCLVLPNSSILVEFSKELQSIANLPIKFL